MGKPKNHFTKEFQRKNQLNEGQKNEERRNPKRNRTGKELEQTSNSSKSSSSSCSRQINVDADTELESEFHSDKITRLTNRLHILQNEYDLNFDQFGEILVTCKLFNKLSYYDYCTCLELVQPPPPPPSTPSCKVRKKGLLSDK